MEYKTDDIVFKVMRLSNGPDDELRKVLPYASVHYNDEDYVLVRPLNSEETFCYGDFVFQRIVSSRGNELNAEVIRDPDTIYRLFTELVLKYRIYERFENNGVYLTNNNDSNGKIQSNLHIKTDGISDFSD